MDRSPARRFRVVRCLGRGGFGEVYLAHMVSAAGLESTVALKLLRVDLEANRDAARRLRDEARALGRLAHPAVLTVLDLTRLDDRLGFVTEYVEGADLTDLLGDRDRGLTVRALLQLIARIADALDAAVHAEGPDGRALQLVHRDIKPANLRVGRHGQPKLLDFGIARFEGIEREARTPTGALIGSLPWMAPERFASAEVTPAADLFALGCVLIEGLSGKRLLPKGSVRELTALALDQEAWEAHVYAQLRGLADVPGPVATLAERMVAFRPEARPSAREVSDRCEALADDLQGASLRRWCANHDWPEPPRVQGSVREGTVLTEATLGLSTGGTSDPHSAEPVIVAASPETFDPSALPEQTPVARRPSRPSTPEAPPAFPSIPLGMALDRAQISKDELSGVIDEPLGDPTEELENPPDLQRVAPAKQSGLTTALAVVGCMLLVAVTVTTFAALVGFAMVMLYT